MPPAATAAIFISGAKIKRPAPLQSRAKFIYAPLHTTMIPTFDQLLRPVLVLATERQITRRDAEQWVIQQFKLSPSEAATKIPSGGAVIPRNPGHL